MAFCIDCGWKINDWAETCASCGKSQAAAIALEVAGVAATPEPSGGWFGRERLLKTWQLGLAALVMLSVGVLIGTLIAPDGDVGAEAPIATLAPAPTFGPTLAPTEPAGVPTTGPATSPAAPTTAPPGFPTQPLTPAPVPTTQPLPTTQPAPVTTPATQFP